MNDRIEYRKSLGLPRRTPTYDERCYDLAALFLGDEPELHTEHNIVGLASLIQDTIEDEIAHLKEQRRAENGQFGVGA